MASRFLIPFGGGTGLFGRDDPFLSLHREVNRLFDETLRGFGGDRGGDGTPGRRSLISPRIDIHDSGEVLEITAELPGVSEKDIDLHVEGDVLTLRGEKKNERNDDNAHVFERTYGSFQRSIQLPFSLDPMEVQANFTDGVLTISIPKQFERNSSQRIQIQSGQNVSQQGQRALGDGASSQLASTDQAAPQIGSGERRAIGGQSVTGGEKFKTDKKKRHTNDRASAST